ncbi:MAG TPA: PPOX class F420-dependent oxidoreductase [Thermomicrobiales bacterium]|nr:PPOX class F420-dependent oxidoreductase [Thermomicrobiales bacterium]
MFTEKEMVYLQSQRLARLATVSPTGQCDADAVGFELDGEVFVIGGRSLTESRKFKNVAAGNEQVSLIVDDIASLDPYEPRGIKMHGIASIVSRDGRFGPGEYIEFRPRTSWSWGVEAPTFGDGNVRFHRSKHRQS